MLIFFFGVFLVACRSEWAHFNPSEGGKRSSIFCWLLADRIVRFLTPKTRGNARHFFVGCFLVPFGSKIDLSDAKLD